MAQVGEFGSKLSVALKALSISRVGLAHDLGVDKSLVGRWASGSVHPSEHNLAKITTLLAHRVGGLTMADWDRELNDFAALFGIELRVEQRSAAGLNGRVGEFLAPFIEIATQETARSGNAYEGFWRTSRSSVLMPGKLFHEYGMIRRAENGLLEVRMMGSGLPFHGWMLPASGNLFVMLQDVTGHTPMSLIFRGVSLPKAILLEGILMLAALDSNRTPAAIPILLERVGDLSGDHAADDARCAEVQASEPPGLSGLSEEEAIAYIERDIGPSAVASGGDPYLLASGTRLRSLGVAPSGRLSG